MTRRTRAILLAAVVLLAGCTKAPGSPATAPTNAAPGSAVPSAWELTTAQVGADGRLSLPVALTAFAQAIGPVPGAGRAAGPAAPIVSGTLAVASVLARWSTLSPAQRTAVRAALGAGPHDAPAAYRAPKTSEDPNLRCLGADTAGAAPYRAMVDSIVPELAGHLGRQLRIADHLFVAVNTKNVEQPSSLYAVPCGDTPDGAVGGCTVHINPKALTSTDAEMRSFLVHELTHCFLFDEFGLEYGSMPAWYVEGAPTWALIALGGSSFRLGTIWQFYLDQADRPLQRRSYSGAGFFVHLAETGTDPWPLIGRIGAAMTGKDSSATAAGWAAAAPTAAFVQSWGGGYVQGRYPGPAWTTGKPPLPAYAPKLPEARLGDGESVSVTAPAFSAAVRRLEVDAEVVTVAAGAGTTGRITLGGGADASLDGGPFCTTGACRCPDGSAGAATTFTKMAGGGGYLGASGGAKAAEVSLTGSTLADFCTRPPGSCLVGSWTATGFAISGKVTESGGAGVRMVIDKSGDARVVFTGMSPVSFTATTGGARTAGKFTFAGTVTGSVKLPPPGATSGRWEQVHSGGTGNLTVDVRITEPVEFHLPKTSVAELAGAVSTGGAIGSPQLTTGTWQCSADTLVSTAPPGSGVTGKWTLKRTG